MGGREYLLCHRVAIPPSPLSSMFLLLFCNIFVPSCCLCLVLCPFSNRFSQRMMDSPVACRGLAGAGCVQHKRVPGFPHREQLAALLSVSCHRCPVHAGTHPCHGAATSLIWESWEIRKSVTNYLLDSLKYI